MYPIFERFWQCCQLFKTLLVVENCINRRLELVFHCLRSVMDFGLNLTCSQNCHHAINKYLINFVKIHNVMDFSSSIFFTLVFISSEIWLILVKAFALCIGSHVIFLPIRPHFGVPPFQSNGKDQYENENYDEKYWN